jgi:hypothetical protein
VTLLAVIRHKEKEKDGFIGRRNLKKKKEKKNKKKKKKDFFSDDFAPVEII